MSGYIYDDGGRAAAGYKGKAGDCVCRAIAIATGLPYAEVYAGLNNAAIGERTGTGGKAGPGRGKKTADNVSRLHGNGTSYILARLARDKRKRGRSSSRTGVYKQTIRKYMESIGWHWVPTMQIGSGCKVHLRAEELPAGRLVVSVSRHSTAVIDGVIHDTHDPRRDGTRCVYGYWQARR